MVSIVYVAESVEKLISSWLVIGVQRWVNDEIGFVRIHLS